jgi:hypothetical protein
MSHFSRLKTSIVEKEFLLAALKDMELQFSEGQDLILDGFQGANRKVDILIKFEVGYPIGLKLRNGKYEIVADWFGVMKTSKKEFSNKLQQRYAYHAAISRLTEQGFSLVEETNNDNQEIRLVLRRMS